MGERYFPLFISMEGKRVLLVGAGTIALRRAKGLLEFGAVLVVTAPEIRTEFYRLQSVYGMERLVLKKAVFSPESVAGMDFVLSATDAAEVDTEVYRVCRERRIPVNIASDQKLCDFQFPALIQHENLVIGVNSGGSDHKKVRQVSEKIREWIMKK